jgi:hypothetical protein
VAIVTRKDVAEIKEHFDQRTAEVASSGWSRSLSPESVRSPGRVIVSGPDIDSALCVAVTAFFGFDHPAQPRESDFIVDSRSAGP